MDKDERDLAAERIATLKLELAELQTSAYSASQGALSTSAEITAQAYPAASPGDTPVEAAMKAQTLKVGAEYCLYAVATGGLPFRARMYVCARRRGITNEHL